MFRKLKLFKALKF